MHTHDDKFCKEGERIVVEEDVHRRQKTIQVYCSQCGEMVREVPLQAPIRPQL